MRERWGLDIGDAVVGRALGPGCPDAVAADPDKMRRGEGALGPRKGETRLRGRHWGLAVPTQ